MGFFEEKIGPELTHCFESFEHQQKRLLSIESSSHELYVVFVYNIVGPPPTIYYPNGTQKETRSQRGFQQFDIESAKMKETSRLDNFHSSLQCLFLRC